MIQPRWIIHFLSFLVLLALLVPVAQAQILEAELKVKGLACPFCAYGLERKLKKLAGAQSVKVFINDDRAQVQFDGKQPPVLDDIRGAVHDAGFKLEGLQVTVQGKRARCMDEPCLQLPDGQIFLLEEEGAGTKLIQSVPEGTPVEVKGIVRCRQPSGHQAHPPSLRVESYQPIKRRRLPGEKK